MKMIKVLLLVFCFSTVGISAAMGGCIKGDCLNGEGTYISSDGSEYVGLFKEGKFHGQGVFSFPDGGKDVGQFEDGRYVGPSPTE